MTYKGIHIQWNHPILAVMLVMIVTASSIIVANPETMLYTFHSAVDQPEWMRLHNFYQFLYQPKHDNWGGRSEKWLKASNSDWYFVTPEHELYQWDGSSKATGELIATDLEPSFYKSPPTTISNSMDVAGAAVNLQGISKISGVKKIGSESSTVEEGSTKCVAQNPSIIVRSCASTNCRQLDSLQYGTKVTITQESQGWYKVTNLDGANGWAATRLFESCEKLQSDSKSAEANTLTTNNKDAYPLCEHCNHYEVTGLTGDEVYNNMRTNAPIVDGQPMAGVTRFSWSYQVADCTRMQQAQISTVIETSMPNWVDFEQGSSLLREEWIKFYNSLLDHENGHSQALVELTQDNEAILLNSSGCEQANEQIYANHSSYRDRNLQYDADTDHGRTQGADASRLLGK